MLLENVFVPVLDPAGNFVGWLESNIYGYRILANPLEIAGAIASPVASPLAPVAWYGGAAVVAVGGSAAVAAAPHVAAGATALYHWAWLNPIAWKCLGDFVGRLFSPPSPISGTMEEYPCGAFGQMISNGISYGSSGL